MIIKTLKRSIQPFLGIPVIVIGVLLGGVIVIDKWWAIYQFPEENQLVYDVGYLKGRRDAYFCHRNRCSYAVTPILTKKFIQCNWSGIYL